MDCVAPLGKGMTIAGEARLAMNVDKLTELAIIISIEHLLADFKPSTGQPGRGLLFTRTGLVALVMIHTHEKANQSP